MTSGAETRRLPQPRFRAVRRNGLESSCTGCRWEPEPPQAASAGTGAFSRPSHRDAITGPCVLYHSALLVQLDGEQFAVQHDVPGLSVELGHTGSPVPSITV
jgi:hypothetical protein